MDSHEENQNNEQDWIKELRRKAEAYDKEVGPLKRENALIKAGIDLSNPVAELFSKAYDGDWEVDAVKEAASKYGLVATGQSTQQVEDQGEQPQSQIREAPSPEELSFQRMAQATQGTAIPTPVNQDWQGAKTMEEFMAKYRAAGGNVSDGLD